MRRLRNIGRLFSSMSLVVAMAVGVFKMSAELALLADLVLWGAEHEGAFAWAYGLKPRRVWRGGSQVFAR